LGFEVTIVMPEHMTEERKALIRSLGADLILCSKEGSFAEAARIRDEMAAKDPNVFNPDQFANPLNVECHRLTTGHELIQQAGTQIDAFVAGVGTGGTLIGVGEALRERWPKVHLVAVEPTEAAVMGGGPPGAHTIFGIGDGFIPTIAEDGNGGLNPMIDEVIAIRSEDALEAAKGLNERHHLCVGISSGANYLAAKRLQAHFENVATVFADGYLKYQSFGLEECPMGACPHQDRCRNSVTSGMLG
jgi:cysteine synthase A